MRIVPAIYLTLGILGVAVAVLVPLTIYRSGSTAVPIWRTAASPGPLSVQHAFLGSQCEACHTPNRGIEAGSCLTCHASDLNRLEKPSTAFHTTIKDCGSCHVEHQGGVRPTRMDHRALVRIGLNSLPDDSRPGAGRAFMQNLATSFGSNVAAQALTCAACHGDRDPHRGFFGQACAACHGTESWGIAGYLHPPATSTACAQCHQAPQSHYTAHFFGMMSMGGTVRVEQCYVCHKVNTWTNRTTAGSFESR